MMIIIELNTSAIKSPLDEEPENPRARITSTLIIDLATLVLEIIE
jgi:hypothetical protein